MVPMDGGNYILSLVNLQEACTAMKTEVLLLLPNRKCVKRLHHFVWP